MVRTPFMPVLRRAGRIITRRRGEGARLLARHTPEGRYAGAVSSRTGIVVLLLAVLAVPVGRPRAQKRKVVTVDDSRHLWATVNVCDPATPPAGRRPRHDRDPRVDARLAPTAASACTCAFALQYFKEADQKWHNVVKGGDSAGSASGSRATRRASPGATSASRRRRSPTIRLRGKVNFEWRLKGEVMRRAVEAHDGGPQVQRGHVPRGLLRGECTISAP